MSSINSEHLGWYPCIFDSVVRYRSLWIPLSDGTHDREIGLFNVTEEAVLAIQASLFRVALRVFSKNTSAARCTPCYDTQIFPYDDLALLNIADGCLEISFSSVLAFACSALGNSSTAIDAPCRIITSSHRDKGADQIHECRMYERRRGISCSLQTRS